VTIMALTEIPPPEDMKRAFLDGLTVNDSLQLNFSLPVYAISIADLVGVVDPLQLKAVGWQFLTIDSKGVVAGEVPNEPDYPGGEITTSLSRGEMIDEALQAARAVRAHPDVLNEAFEFRRLRISGLGIEAFWLKSLPVNDNLSATDRVWSYAAFEDELNAKLLSANDFLKVVRKLAVEEIGFKNEPPSY
jgi:hypothetical protein